MVLASFSFFDFRGAASYPAPKETFMLTTFVSRAAEDLSVAVSPVPPLWSLRRRSQELYRLLRDRGVVAVNAEYHGMEGRGGFDSLRFTTADGTDCLVIEGERNLQLKALFRAMLLARDPDWCHGAGSCVEFRWDLRRDSVMHRHFPSNERRERSIEPVT
jgi:hypothetical protein